MNKKLYPVLRQGRDIQQEDDGGSDFCASCTEGSDDDDDIGEPASLENGIGVEDD